MKGKTESSIIIVRDFNSLLSIINSTARQKINKETNRLQNHKLTRPNRYLQNIQDNRVSVLKYTWNIFQDRHMPGHKGNLSKFTKIKTIQGMFFDYSGMKLELNSRNTFGKIINMWR